VTFPAGPDNRVFGRIPSGPIWSLFTSVLTIQITFANRSQEEFRDIFGCAEKGRFCVGRNALFQARSPSTPPFSKPSLE